jgi:UTP--glucose-1-phosphate uridylyltransferase
VADGGYILTPDIFQALKDTDLGKGNELWLADAINKLKSNHKLYACEVQNGKYYDTGNKMEYLKANIDYALMREDMAPELKEYIRSLNI